MNKIIEDFEVICGGNSENNFYFSVSTDYSSENATIPENIAVYDPQTLVWEGINSLYLPPAGQTKIPEGVWAENQQESLKLDIFDANRAVQLHFSGKTQARISLLGFEFKGLIYDE